MFGPKLSVQKQSEPNASQRVRGKCCSGQKLRAFRKKSRTLWPQLPQWRTFAKLKPKGTRKILFGPKGTCILQIVTYPVAPTATLVDFCQIQAKGYEENVVRAKGYVHFAKSHVPFGPSCHNGRLPNSGQSSRGFFGSSQRVHGEICNVTGALAPIIKMDPK